MRVIAVTDIHAAYDVVESILAREAPFDAVLIGGDLTTRGTGAEAEAALRRFSSFGAPVLAVAGNMDSPDVERVMERTAKLLDGRGCVLDGIGFFGVSGGPLSPLHTPYEIPEEEILRRAAKGWKEVEMARRKIFVPHPPPLNTRLDTLRSGKHVGSAAVRQFIDEHAPDAVVCGHIHEARGTDVLAATQMINCGPAHLGWYGVLTIGKEILLESKGVA